MKLQINTTLGQERIPATITDIDTDEILKDSWLVNEMFKLAIMSMTYRAKAKLIASGAVTFTFTELKLMWLGGSGLSIGVAFIDKAIAMLLRAGVNVGSRPRKTKGEEGSESPTVWAANINLHEKVQDHYNMVARSWDMPDPNVITLADLASLLEWKHDDDARKQAAELTGSFDLLESEADSDEPTEAEQDVEA